MLFPTENVPCHNPARGRGKLHSLRPLLSAGYLIGGLLMEVKWLLR